jgi:farnesyl diphosphate synthase
VSVIGLAAARRMADELRQEAHEAIRDLGARAHRLSALADYIVLRKF